MNQPNDADRSIATPPLSDRELWADARLPSDLPAGPAAETSPAAAACGGPRAPTRVQRLHRARSATPRNATRPPWLPPTSAPLTRSHVAALRSHVLSDLLDLAHRVIAQLRRQGYEVRSWSIIGPDELGAEWVRPMDDVTAAVVRYLAVTEPASAHVRNGGVIDLRIDKRTGGITVHDDQHVLNPPLDVVHL